MPARTLARALVLALALAPASAVAQAQPPATPPRAIRAMIGLPGMPAGHSIVVTVDRDSIDGCRTNTGVCTRTRSVALDAADRAELDRLLGAIRAMPRCEPIAYAPGDPLFEITLPDERSPRVGRLPADPRAIDERTDEPCEAEHALAAWIMRRFLQDLTR